MILGFNLGFLEVSIGDIADVLLLSLLLMQAYKLVKGSLAIRVFLGFLLLYLLYLLVDAAGMELVTNLLGQFMGLGVLAVIILFQQEIRRFLLFVGKTTTFNDSDILKNIRYFWSPQQEEIRTEINSIVDAAKNLSTSNTGALLVISKGSELKFYADTGDRMDSIISKRLLLSIFNKYSPMHDGAAIIFKDRIVAARCILPVTQREDIPPQMGLRHRAAVGMSEETDALLMVVSEESGQITVIQQGLISQNLSQKELRSKLQDYLIDDPYTKRIKQGKKISGTIS